MITRLQLVSIVSIFFFLFGVAVYIPGITRRRATYCRLNPNVLGSWGIVMGRLSIVDGARTEFICVRVTRSVGIENLLVPSVRDN